MNANQVLTIIEDRHISDYDLELEAEKLFSEVIRKFNTKLASIGCVITPDGGSQFFVAKYPIFCDENDFSSDKKKQEVIKKYAKRFSKFFNDISINTNNGKFDNSSWRTNLRLSFSGIPRLIDLKPEYKFSFLIKLEIFPPNKNGFLLTVTFGNWRFMAITQPKDFYNYYVTNDKVYENFHNLVRKFKDHIDQIAKAIRLTSVG